MNIELGIRRKIIILIFLVTIIGLLLSFSITFKNASAEVAQGTYVDPNTYSSYSNIITNRNIGEVWTDKSVSSSSMTINNKTITKNTDEDFLSSLSVLSTGLDLNIKEGNVKDIIILQDLSGSMGSSVTSSSGTMSRLQASKNAINNLLIIIANVNSTLSAADEKFKVSLISFGSVGQETVHFNLTEVNSSNLTSLQNIVNGMDAPGGTYVAPGLTLVINQIATYGRRGVDACVITFMDGDAMDAAETINLAYTIKNTYHAIMYSIVLDDSATGGTTSSIDIIGQSLSSNYDYASSQSSLGTQTGDSYYFTPTNADDLINSFEKVIRAIQRKVYTIENGTNLTIKDTLGNYMGVKRIKAIVYDGVLYTNVSSSTSGSVTTYTFSGVVADSTGTSANLNRISIKVTKSTNAKTGDVIDISIPSNLVPLSVYDVTSTFLTNSTVYTTTLDEKAPLAIVYSSSVKSEVPTLYKNNDGTLETYVRANGSILNGKGTAYFYANSYSSGSNGTTTVTFKPYSSNDYYYYVENSYLYTRSGSSYILYTGTTLPSGTYYIKRTAYTVGSNRPSTEYYEAVSSTGALRDSKNNWYISSGTKKTVTSTQTKSSNTSGTASNVKSIAWSGSNIRTLLGNNGKTAVEMDIDKISIKVTKVWNDANNQDGIRPSSVTIELYADGVSKGSMYTMTLNASNNWTYTYPDLPEKSGGVKINYTVKEKNVASGYTETVTGSMNTGYTITNTHTPRTVDLNIKKIWDDSNNQDGKRPDDVTVELFANGASKGSSFIAHLNQSNNWTYTYKNLPENSAGSKISYTVKETNIKDGYRVGITGSMSIGYTITNSYTTEIMAITVTKVWDDNDDQDGKRPEDVTIMLKANGKELGANYKMILSSDNNWTYTYTNLPKYESGKIIDYSVSEEEVEEYEVDYTKTSKGSNAEEITITNTHEPELVDITVNKEWIDNNNQDGIRPDNVEIYLTANDKKDEENKVILNEENDFTYTWKDFPKYQNGSLVKYDFEETEVDGYVYLVTGTVEDGFTITNYHDVEMIDIDVNKVWDDQDNQDLLRPDNITLMLYADDEFLGDNYKVDVTEYNNWAYKFETLPKYKEGKEIAYKVVEKEVEYYTTDISGTKEAGFVVTNTHVIENPQTGYRTIMISLVITIASFILYLININKDKLFKI